MGHFGFSWMGLIFLTLMFVPNLLWTRCVPEGYTDREASRVLTLFERVGQLLTFSTALCFSDTNWQPLSPWSLWLLAAFIAIALYEGWWIRYFRSSKTLADFYRGYLGIPLAGATLPLASLFLLGVYGRLIWLPLSVLVMAVGHIGIHRQHAKENHAQIP
ncbi:MAG: hypothetical protein PHY12_15050 [Eubacteriales bacterium]|nr:hypothetical protein [Eubacteriales bacterium]